MVCGSQSFSGNILLIYSCCFPGLQFEMLNAELEENQELANSRMAELEKLQQEMQQAVRTNEKLKVAMVLPWGTC